jgi:predicted dehydrogenase
MEPYRTLLVGTGGIGEAHVRAVEATAGRARLVAAVDIDAARVNAFCERHHIPGAYTDFATALQAEKPGLVLIAAPPGLHTCMSIASMEAGAYVLCEKPLCGSLEELDAIEAAAARTGRQTACVFQMRFASSTTHVRRLAASGILGRCLVACCNTLWYRDTAYYAVPWRGRWKTDFGGPTVGHGIHAMDQLLLLLGDWVEVRAMAGTLGRAIETEDVSMALVRFAGGAHASIVNSVISPRQESHLRLDFEHATIELTHLYSFGREHWKMTPAAAHEGDSLEQAWQAFPMPDAPCSHGLQLAEFLRDIAEGRAHPTSGAGARNTIELLTAIYKSALTGQPVTRGSILPGDPFYASLHGGAPIPRWGAPPPKA